MTGALDLYHAHLSGLDAAASRRRLVPQAGVDFASNDYLALAGSDRLRRALTDAVARGVPAGSGGSRLLRGNHAELVALEDEAAAAFGAEAALYFSSGFAANGALFAALPQRGDLVVYDALVHASVHDGMRLGRAECVAAAHNDVAAFAAAIAGWRARGGAGRPWIAVESLYSMDGDCAPLAALQALARVEDGFLVVDEAHATGVWGAGGRGLSADLPPFANTIVLRTLGKALGCEGALLCAPAVLIDFLVNRARPFIFSTAPSPVMAAVARVAIASLADEPERRARLHRLIAHAATALEPLGVARTGSQILALMLGDNARAVAVAAALQARGFDVRAIRPPTVPPGTARLRISLTLNASEADVDALARALAAVL
jgi:8-amino-7-oxononanoate synthase